MLKRGMLNAQGKFLLARTGHLDYLGILADKIVAYAPELLKEYEKRFTKEKIEFIPDGQPFREKMKQCKGVFRTGQYWLHCPNVIIQAGCTYEEGYVD